jgi:hypothetical protein
MKSYPPSLDKILEHCPQAGALYTRIWRDRNKDGGEFVIYTKEMIVTEYALSWKKFKNDLRLLKKEGVIGFSISSNDKVRIVLLDFHALKTEKAA